MWVQSDGYLHTNTVFVGLCYLSWFPTTIAITTLLEAINKLNNLWEQSVCWLLSGNEVSLWWRSKKVNDKLVEGNPQIMSWFWRSCCMTLTSSTISIAWVSLCNSVSGYCWFWNVWLPCNRSFIHWFFSFKSSIVG